MSVYIPGMEMPEEGWHKVIKIFSNGEVVSYYDSVELGKAIPVPDHGRLIDGDALYEKFVLLESEAMGALQTTGIGSVDGIKWSAILTERTGYKFDIVDAPTIIPADPAEENVNNGI